MCNDGYARARFSTSFISTSLLTLQSSEYVYDVEAPPEWKDLPSPTCSIPAEDCENQWQAFTDAFRNSTSDLPCPSNSLGCKPLHSKNRFEQSFFYGGSMDHLKEIFGGCSALKSICLRNFPEYVGLDESLARLGTITPSQNDTKQNACGEAQTREKCLDDLAWCNVKVGRFMMIYFPEVITSRDICGNQGFGTAKTLGRTSNDNIMTATVENITFGVYQRGDGTYKKASSSPIPY
jgi:hypothetical protein